jgi:hypothetical protein
MIAHIAGAPIEELLPLLASSAAAAGVAVNMAVGALRHRRRRPSPDLSAGTTPPSGEGDRSLVMVQACPAPAGPDAAP